MPSKWMVDIKGKEGEGGGRTLKRVLTDLDFPEFINKQGSLAATVQSEIEKYGYTITDRGAGGGSWHIGVPFQDLESAVFYLYLLTDIFQNAIAAELLQFELKTWSPSSWNKRKRRKGKEKRKDEGA